MAHELKTITQSIVANNKGILAADEATGTIKKRFDAIGVESTEENRRAYREMLFTTPGAGRAHQRRDPVRRDDPAVGDRRDAVRRSCCRVGIIPGIKVDTGARAAGAVPGETVTEGLDGLRERLAEYRELGARFAKWRAVITIGERHPDRTRDPRERARAGAVRGALPGGRRRPDRGARGADGRRSLDRALRAAATGGRCRPCTTSWSRSASTSRARS